MVKLTVLYGHPDDSAAFERYYAERHMPLVGRIAGVARTERARVVGTPDGTQPPFYRTFEFWFDTPDCLQTAMASPEGRAAVADLPHFASGGVTILIADVED
jgi:uncharacterized protein (TIGR02118 family)